MPPKLPGTLLQSGEPRPIRSLSPVLWHGLGQLLMEGAVCRQPFGGRGGCWVAQGLARAAHEPDAALPVVQLVAGHLKNAHVRVGNPVKRFCRCRHGS